MERKTPALVTLYLSARQLVPEVSPEFLRNLGLEFLQLISGLLRGLLLVFGLLGVEGVAPVVLQWLLQAERKEGLPALQREPDLKIGV